MVVLQTIVRTFKRHPLVANCTAYATFSASAELIQQHFEVKADGSEKVLGTSLEIRISMTVCPPMFSQFSPGITPQNILKNPRQKYLHIFSSGISPRKP